MVIVVVIESIHVSLDIGGTIEILFIASFLIYFANGYLINIFYFCRHCAA